MRTEGHVTSTEPSTAAPASWDVEFHRLRARFPRVKDSILFCVHALQQADNVALDDLKAQAQMHRIRVTGASLTAAWRQLQKRDPAASGPPAARPVPKPRPTETATDLEQMLRQVIGRAHGDADAEVARLKAAVRKTIAALRAALE